MHSYRVVAVGDRLANTVRTTLLSPGYGHPARTEVATGYGPCRQCLRTFAIGSERRILFTFDPFHAKEDLPLPGPVLERLLRDRDVSYIHVRDTDAGCYDFLIERTSEEEGLDEGKASAGASSHE